jgi:hypothetical protein
VSKAGQVNQCTERFKGFIPRDEEELSLTSRFLEPLHYHDILFNTRDRGERIVSAVGKRRIDSEVSFYKVQQIMLNSSGSKL